MFVSDCVYDRVSVRDDVIERRYVLEMIEFTKVYVMVIENIIPAGGCSAFGLIGNLDSNSDESPKFALLCKFERA